MYAVDIELQNGKKIEALVYDWSPEKGRIDILNERNGDREVINLQDVKSGKFYSDRDRNYAKCEDLLEKAYTDGYKK
jgi:hypothetical protein